MLSVAQSMGQQLLTTGALLLVTVGVVWATPLLIEAVVDLVVALLERQGWAERAETIWSYTPPGVSLVGIVYSLQAATITLATLFLFSIWSGLPFVRDLVSLLVSSLPGLARLLLTGVVLASTYTATSYIGDSIYGLSEQETYLEEHTREIVTRTAQIVVILGGVLTVLSLWKVNVGNVLIGAGMLSILIGFAARETFSSVVAGFVLMFSRPFEVGDWIAVSGKEGRVTDVTIVHTRLRTPEAEIIVIPNDIIGQSEVVNYTEEEKLCLTLDFSVEYGADLDAVEETVQDALGDVELHSEGSTPEVFPEDFGDSGIQLEARFWIDEVHPRLRWRARAEAIQAIQDALGNIDVTIPYPQRTIHAGNEDDQAVAPTPNPGD
ncbi:mechanosensitive ion channel family protein [Halospeciosus flavus]|uniref:Mechanosensitive ion channel family protein n=1 Tax=Halospeciosus flavus TaxID=3032283 RepID=A0ABD5Z6L7_9EURY|nr:mechanosensitive ion channel family protein [Halospeciosus flavus]